MSDPLLVGQLKNFPSEAQQMIEAARGLEQFLLQSLLFVIRDGVIGLMSQAVFFQHTMDDDSLLASFPSHTCSIDDSEPKAASHLNPSAKEFLPQFKHLSLNDSSESYDQCLISETTCPALPNPYVFDSSKLNFAFEQQDGPGTVKSDYAYFPNIPVNVFNTEALSSSNHYIHFKEDICPKIKTIFVQVRSFKNYFIVFGHFILFFLMANNCLLPSLQTLLGNKDTSDDVAINTEPYAQFEKNRVSFTTHVNLLLFIYLWP